jgi:hypothetical protein
MRLFLNIGIGMRDSFLRDHPDLINDADVWMLVAIAAMVILGHSEGRPLTAHKVALTLNIDRNTAKRKLDKLVRLGPFVIHDEHYFLEPKRSGPIPPELEAHFGRAFYDALKTLVPLADRHPNFGMSVQIEPSGR